MLIFLLRLTVAGLDYEWKLKAGFEYSKPGKLFIFLKYERTTALRCSKTGTRRLSDLLRANRHIFGLSEEGIVSFSAAPDPETRKGYLLRSSAIDTIMQEYHEVMQGSVSAMNRESNIVAEADEPPSPNTDRESDHQEIADAKGEARPSKRKAPAKSLAHRDPAMKRRRSEMVGVAFEE